jgi:predicted dithiol-disulfide oxidoreductase (DUF899 family)
MTPRDKRGLKQWAPQALRRHRVPLTGLSGDSRQLIIQHVMSGPDWDAAGPGCSAGIGADPTFTG